MHCTICKKTNEEISLSEGISKDGMVMICEGCSESEGIPIILKPSERQLEKADERYSVRERMERMSGMRETTEISDEQNIVQGNLAKLRMPEKKQFHSDVLDEYYWTLTLARRRLKLTHQQLSEQIKIDAVIIRSIEKGKIPENFEEIFLKLESFLGIKLLKNHVNRIKFTRTVDEEREILESVRVRMSRPKSGEEEMFDELEKDAKLEKISNGEMDLSKRENLENLTLDDLVEMKKKRETRTKKTRQRIQTDAMVGDDLDLDLEEL